LQEFAGVFFDESYLYIFVKYDKIKMIDMNVTICKKVLKGQGIHMQNEKLSKEEFLYMFREDVIRLSRYIPWLEKKSGKDVSKNYQDGDKMKHTLSFPVYDSVLLSFLNDASMTVFMEQNYQYFYTRNRVKDYQDELRMIEAADIMHMDTLQCILSRYVFGGMTKAYLWKDGVEHRIFLNVLKKAKEIVEFNDQPLDIEDTVYPETEGI